ncbi:MAG: winged helix-turn-helix transcriptional regulator [Planctomycetes bacterium]|nr:winged helix-turn-helix transcriptional regulator [Planctomycetota bacterium]
MGPIHERLADALGRFAALSRASEQRASSPANLTPLQGRALALLSRRGPIRVGALAKELMVAYATASEALTTLESKGLVVKEAAPDEHRAVLVDLTRKGRTIARRASGWVSKAIETAVSTLDDGEAGAILAGLIKLLVTLEADGAILEARMCVSCRYFESGGGQGARPHYCHLLESSIGTHELRVDCPEHERGSPDQVSRAVASFRLV